MRVRAAGLNFLDVLACRGSYPNQPPYPLPIGVELAGELIAAAAGAGAGEQRSVAAGTGSTVLGIAPLPLGALAGEVTLPAELVHVVDAGVAAQVSPSVLAAVPVNYQTAWFALHRTGRLRAGETVALTAAAGGLGTALVQLAHHAGARVVALAGGPEKMAYCLQEGADVALDSSAGGVVPAVLEVTGGAGADLVVDSVGARALDEAVDYAAFEGRVVSVGFSAGAAGAIDPSRLYRRNLSLAGLSWGEHYPRRYPELVGAVYDELLALLAAGRIRPRVEEVPFSDVPAALERLASRRTVGKLVARLPAKKEDR